MITLKRILVATDFSDYSKAALDYACALSERFDAELHLLHVMQDLVALLPEPGMLFPPPGDYMGELRASVEKSLAGLPDPDWVQGKRVVRSVREGVPFVEIVRYAKEHDVDLIVIGTHGRSGLAHALLGSVAEKVVRKAPCAVLTVRSGEHRFVMP